MFDLAKLFYRIVFGDHTYRAIDLHGTAVAEQYDLNRPLPFSEQFDVVTNFGTAEHIFNQLQMFKSVHDTTKPGGLMIHSLPNQGCYDHGFYNYHPTFVFDLSQANRYEVVTLQHTDGTKTPTVLTLLPDRNTYVRLALEKKLSDYSGLMTVLRGRSIKLRSSFRSRRTTTDSSRRNWPRLGPDCGVKDWFGLCGL